MKLYYATGACSLAAHIIINELELPCEFVKVDLKTKQTANGADYLKINPKGAVPALLLEDDNLLTENAIILLYLADTHDAAQLLPSGKAFERYKVLEWLNFVSTDLHRLTGPLFSAQFPQEAKDMYKGLLTNKLARVNNVLKEKKYLAGDHFTLPDAYLFVILTWLVSLKISFTDWPNLMRYFNELKLRPAIQKTLKEEGIPLATDACQIP